MFTEPRKTEMPEEKDISFAFPWDRDHDFHVTAPSQRPGRYKTALH